MVAKGAKRKANVVATEDELVLEKCSGLASVLTDAANLPSDVVSMLTELLPHSLGQPKDKRHRFQEQAIQSVDRVMIGIEESLKNNIADARAKLEEAQRAAAPSEAVVVEADKKLRDDSERFSNETKVLAKATLAFREARAAADWAEKLQVSGDKEFESSESKKVALEEIVNDFIAPLKNGTLEEPEMGQKIKTLLLRLKSFDEIDEAMMMVIGSALAKKIEVRGNFDVMALEQLDKCMAQRIAPLDEILKAGEAGKQERANAVKTAQEAFRVAQGAQKQRAEIFQAAWKLKKEDEDGLQAAHLGVKDLKAKTKAADKTLYRAEAEFECFEDYARKTFEELKERPTPPVPVEPVESVEPVEPEICHAEVDAVEGAQVAIEAMPEAVAAA